MLPYSKRYSETEEGGRQNMFAVNGFVANHQPPLAAPSVVDRFKFPCQMTMSEYLDVHCAAARASLYGLQDEVP